MHSTRPDQATLEERVRDAILRTDAALADAFESPIRTRFGADDRLLDSLYPQWVQPFSEVHWTPLSVALQAVQLLGPSAGDRVLDMGSGIGKFCVVGGVANPTVEFIGVEQRPRLVRIAQKMAQRLGLDNVHYLHGAIDSIDLTGYDAAYMFNPFGEHMLAHQPQMDGFQGLSSTRFWELVMLSEQHLDTARPGFRVVTYHGFGGDMPRAYERLGRESAGTDFLELWMKRK